MITLDEALIPPYQRGRCPWDAGGCTCCRRDDGSKLGHSQCVRRLPSLMGGFSGESTFLSVSEIHCMRNHPIAQWIFTILVIAGCMWVGPMSVSGQCSMCSALVS